MPVILMGKDSNRAGKPYNADASEYVQLTTPGGLNLTVGVIADAIGGGERGEAAAKLAVKVALEHLTASAEKDPIALLRGAFTEANKQVYTFRDSQPDANAPSANKGASLAIAIIVNGEKLYVASLGTCRVYLYLHREARLTQLTLDHTFANVIAQQGRMSMQAAKGTQQATQIVKSIGVPMDVTADTGFYLNTTDLDRATEMGRQGYSMTPGDAVVMTSGGMTRRKGVGGLLVPEPDVLTALTTLPTGDAARAIVDAALAQKPDDSLSVVILQPQFRYGGQRAPINRRAAAIVSLLLVGLVVAFLIAAMNTAGREPEISVETQEANRVAFIETSIQSTINAFSPTPSETPTQTPSPTDTPTHTPTYTPRPTLIEDEIGAWFINSAQGGERTVLTELSSVETGSDYYVVAVNHDPDTIPNDANIYAQPDTVFSFRDVSDDELRVSLSHGDIFLDTGDYPVAFVEFDRAPQFTLWVRGSSMSVAGSDLTRVVVNCFEGECSYRFGDLDDPSTIPPGEFRVFDLESETELNSGTISTNDAVYYQSILSNTLGGLEDFTEYVASYMPTPTPTRIPPTRTRVPPTATFVIDTRAADLPTPTFAAPSAPTRCSNYGC